jgi:hypothetical protein
VDTDPPAKPWIGLLPLGAIDLNKTALCEVDENPMQVLLACMILDWIMTMDFEILDETAFEVAADVGLICYDLGNVPGAVEILGGGLIAPEVILGAVKDKSRHEEDCHKSHQKNQ